jgi:hypothetical protein
MASADFSKRIPWPCGIGSLIARHVWRSPRVRRNPFPRLPPDLPMSHPSGYRASLSMARLPCEHRPCIRFLFVGSEFCLRLPPDPASRQRPCLQLTVPTTTACSGLAPYRITSCLAHHHKKGRPVRAAFSIICFLSGPLEPGRGPFGGLRAAAGRPARKLGLLQFHSVSDVCASHHCSAKDDTAAFISRPSCDEAWQQIQC